MTDVVPYPYMTVCLGRMNERAYQGNQKRNAWEEVVSDLFLIAPSCLQMVSLQGMVSHHLNHPIRRV